MGHSRVSIKGLISSGLLAPVRGVRRSLQFSYQDLVLLRTAQELAEAGVPARRIARSLLRLRNQLPRDRPLSAVRVGAQGDDVIVSDGANRWRADDGQYLLAFEASSASQAIALTDGSNAEPASRALDWFVEGCRLEEIDAPQAMAAYQKAVSEDACQAGAYANWGRLLHAGGHLAEAASVYVEGVKSCPEDVLILFNFAVLREDQGRTDEAITLYTTVLEKAPDFADAHYNLGRLYQDSGHLKDAVRHLNAYRKYELEPEH
ncbi:MAG TPA: tetratricopeptide repeat protein [Burkholderiales bacterium]|nr:tetratricopeptide repeat protein [Burkholderiales bacterium]